MKIRTTVKNKYNLTMSKIRRLKVADKSRVAPPLFWRNDVYLRIVRERVIEGMAIWASYYRENIDKFVIEYLGFINLKWFQLALLCMMNRSRTFLGERSGQVVWNRL